MEATYKYDAFISYRHLVPDKLIADRLQKLLEIYESFLCVVCGRKRSLFALERRDRRLFMHGRLFVLRDAGAIRSENPAFCG